MYVLRIRHAGRRPLSWYFDSAEQNRLALFYCGQYGAAVIEAWETDTVPSDDYITDAGELRAYLTGESA